jgi:Tol biopolymer transport system component
MGPANMSKVLGIITVVVSSLALGCSGGGGGAAGSTPSISNPPPATIPAPAAARLAFGAAPAALETRGTTFAPFTVRIEEPTGALITTGSDVVTITHNGSGTLTGTLSRAASGGIARFDDLEHSVPETIRLTVSSGTLTPISSSVAVELEGGLPVAWASQSFGGGEPNNRSFLGPHFQSWRPKPISRDGRYLAFTSDATNLVSAPNPSVYQDVFVRDRFLGSSYIVSRKQASADGGNNTSSMTSISSDGRFIAFTSAASDLGPAKGTVGFDIYVRDGLLGTTERVSQSASGGDPDDMSLHPAISANGRFVAFESSATNLIAGETAPGTRRNIYLRDRQTATTERISVAPGGGFPAGDCEGPVISDDGRFVAFCAIGSDLDGSGPVGQVRRVFVRDRSAGITQRMDAGATTGNSLSPSISGDGRFVAFTSFDSGLVPSDTNFAMDAFLRDRLTGTIERVNLTSTNQQSTGATWTADPSVSDDGRYVTFVTAASLVPADTNLDLDIYVRDRLAGTTARVVDIGVTVFDSMTAHISGNGRYIVFDSLKPFAAGDTGSDWDVFVVPNPLSP